jgi:hypothetical protein
VNQEDARATYTGALLASTGSLNTTNANVTFAATVQDIKAVDPTLSPPNPDTYGGDIKTATVTFWDVTSSPAKYLCTAPVGYASSADTLTGTATCTAGLTANSTSGGTPYNVRAVVGQSSSGGMSGNYVNPTNDLNAEATVNVYIPQSNFITGGGYLVNQSSSGLYPGALGARTNFGFNVKYNKSGTNLQGNINTIIRNSGRIYQIKGNSMTSLVTQACASGNPSPTCIANATFNGKASIQDITNPTSPLPIDGNATLQVTMHDSGSPGTGDTIGITVWSKSGGMWFSSKWSGTATIEQLLDGGDLSVH